jgi:hypothetical protein
MTVAAVIKSMASELGISQTELAARARMSRASLSLKLNERRDLTLPEVERLAAVLGTSVRELLDRVERTTETAPAPEESRGYAIADKATGVVILQASHGSIYDEDIPA